MRTDHRDLEALRLRLTETPGDDDLRLVYADALEECGDERRAAAQRAIAGMRLGCFARQADGRYLDAEQYEALAFHMRDMFELESDENDMYELVEGFEAEALVPLVTGTCHYLGSKDLTYVACAADPYLLLADLLARAGLSRGGAMAIIDTELTCPFCAAADFRLSTFVNDEHEPGHDPDDAVRRSLCVSCRRCGRILLHLENRGVAATRAFGVSRCGRCGDHREADPDGGPACPQCGDALEDVWWPRDTHRAGRDTVAPDAPPEARHCVWCGARREGPVGHACAVCGEARPTVGECPTLRQCAGCRDWTLALAPCCERCGLRALAGPG